MRSAPVAITFVIGAAITASCPGQNGAAAPDGAAHTAVEMEPVRLSRLFEIAPAAMQQDRVDEVSADDWRVQFNSWIWLMGIEGDIGVRGLTTDVSADFGDILDASDSLVALSGRLEVGKGAWGAFIDAFYADLGVEDVSGPLGFASVDVTFEEFLVDFGVMYRIGEWEPSGNAAHNVRDTTLDLYAGGRYVNLEIELEPAVLASRSGDADWIDPIVGLKLVMPLSERWHLRANGDVGGFGVESDFTWSVTGVFGYDFSLFEHPATVYLGYRALGMDYTEGSGASRFTWDVIQHGPMLGFGLRF